jgi:hypothetical protein
MKPKVHYRIHNYPPPVPILNQLDPVHTATSYFLKMHLNIIVLSTPARQIALVSPGDSTHLSFAGFLIITPPKL